MFAPFLSPRGLPRGWLGIAGAATGQIDGAVRRLFGDRHQSSLFLVPVTPRLPRSKLNVATYVSSLVAYLPVSPLSFVELTPQFPGSSFPRPRVRSAVCRPVRKAGLHMCWHHHVSHGYGKGRVIGSISPFLALCYATVKTPDICALKLYKSILFHKWQTIQ